MKFAILSLLFVGCSCAGVHPKVKQITATSSLKWEMGELSACVYDSEKKNLICMTPAELLETYESQHPEERAKPEEGDQHFKDEPHKKIEL